MITFYSKRVGDVNMNAGSHHQKQRNATPDNQIGFSSTGLLRLPTGEASIRNQLRVGRYENIVVSLRGQNFMQSLQLMLH